MFKLGRLAALGLVASALVGTSWSAAAPAPESPPDPRAPSAPELYGSDVEPRVRWTCACGQRNDTKLRPPISVVEPVSCRRCHKIARIQFARAA